MSWTEELYCIYELNCGRESGGASMLPIAHSTANAQIELTIDENGCFVNARKVEKDCAETIIPATEDSASRTGGICAMPFADKLIYIAGDYEEYVESTKKSAADCFTAYITQLEDWKNSEHTHPSVQALYKYIVKKSVMHDLVLSGVLEYDDFTKTLKEKVKISGIAQEDSFVRFIVNYPDEISRTWEDQSLSKSFIAYNSSKMTERQLCYASGEIVPVTYKHPSKIRHSGDKAKLFSANDESGFSYRGRFTDKQQAVSMGYEYSQKVHNALRWLIKKQGMPLDSLTLITWASGLKEVPDFKNRLITDNNIEEEDFEPPSTMERYTGLLKKSIFGFKSKLPVNSKIMILGIDSATTGRMNISLYSEIESSEFLRNLESWHSSTAFLRFNSKLKTSMINSFSLIEIIKCAVGTEQGNYIDCDKRVMREYMLRMIPCATQRVSIPLDILDLLYHKASQPLSYGSAYNHRLVLETACGMIRKNLIDKNNITKEDCFMAYDPNENDRSYLFGCLLAIADKAERDTYESLSDGRITNARRYWNVFSARPYQTWKIIEERLRPYMDKLNAGARISYEKKINEITDKMTPAEFTKNSRLEPLYLLGYHHYTSYLYGRKTEEN